MKRPVLKPPLPGFVLALLLILAWLASRNESRTGVIRTTSTPGLRKGPAAVASGASAPGPPGRDFPIENPLSQDPSERALARGQVIAERLRPSATAGRWLRERLVRSEVQERLIHVKEDWQDDPVAGCWLIRGRSLYLADQMIVRGRQGVSLARLQAGLGAAGMSLLKAIAKDLYTVRIPAAGLDAHERALAALDEMSELVQEAEPDGVGFGAGMPNDSSFYVQWGHHNTGQSGGAVDADVDAPEFWDILEATPGLVVAVLDSGLNMTHPDLLGLAWTHPGETAGDGVDNDGNGRVDDVNGWDFVNGDNNPTDDHGHGSNVTGIIAATRNNATGVAGMLGGVKVQVCKILNASNSGLTSNLIAATTYARLLGVPVMNLSLQNYPFSSSLDTEFMACQTAGILLCICAGNQGLDNDITPNYPSCHTQDNIIAVGNHDRIDVRYTGSNYGDVSVDLFAPGTTILSPVLGTAYSNYTGTSQATPYVTSVALAIKYLNPSWQAAEIKNSILASVVTRPAYGGICLTGGRLNAVTAVSHAVRQLPLRDSDQDGYSNLLEYVAGTRLDAAYARPQISLGISAGFFRAAVPFISRPDATLEVERSEDLGNWQSSGVTGFNSGSVIEGGIPEDGSLGRYLRIRAVAAP